MKNTPSDIKRLMATVRSSRVYALCEFAVFACMMPMAVYMATTNQLPQALLLGCVGGFFLNNGRGHLKQARTAKQNLNRLMATMNITPQNRAAKSRSAHGTTGLIIAYLTLSGIATGYTVQMIKNIMTGDTQPASSAAAGLSSLAAAIYCVVRAYRVYSDNRNQK